MNYSDIFILFLIIVLFSLARFTVNSLYNKDYFDDIKYKIDSLKHRKFFWKLMQDSANFSLSQIFTICSASYGESDSARLRLRNMMYGSNVENNKGLPKNIINKGMGQSHAIDIFLDELEKRERNILILLARNSTMHKEELLSNKNELFQAKNAADYIYCSKEIEEIFAWLFGNIEDKKEVDLWTIKNHLEKSYSGFVSTYKERGGTKSGFIAGVFIVQEIINNLMVEKIQDGNDKIQLANLLYEWDELNKLKWIYASYFGIGSSYIFQFFIFSLYGDLFYKSY